VQTLALPSAKNGKMVTIETSVPQQYITWPGLGNPHAHEPVSYLRDELDRRKAARGLVARVWGVVCRITRKANDLASWFADGITASKKRTIVEVLLTLPVAALAVEPARDWVDKYNLWVVIAVCMVVSYGLALTLGRKEDSDSMTTTIRDFALREAAVTTIAQHVVFDNHMKGHASTPAEVRGSVQSVLAALSDLAVRLLQIPGKVNVHANMFTRMPIRLVGQEGPVDGCGVVCYGKRPPEPTWTRLSATDIGVAEVFGNGKVQVFENTRDAIWCGLFDHIHTRSFVCLPILGLSDDVVAVVTISADQPNVFTRANAHKILHQALAGPLSLLGNILYVTRNGNRQA
jgi:hypothetical protein